MPSAADARPYLRKGVTIVGSELAVIIKNVSKIYRIYNNQNERILDLLFKKSNIKEFYALKGVSFSAEKGECVGLAGLNGSGKSTLADIIGGISEPSIGRATINGSSSLISIGSGLSPQLTGIENIEFKGLMIGLKKQQVDKLKESIIDFADIGEFITQPVKTYSSGMRSRLGFAIAVNIDPDILVIDEALSVGDPSFTQKCLDKMNAFREQGKTIFFVTHSVPQMRSFCSKVVWLEFGIMKAFGESEEVLPMYERFLADYNKMTKAEREAYKREAIERQRELMQSSGF